MMCVWKQVTIYIRIMFDVPSSPNIPDCLSKNVQINSIYFFLIFRLNM